MLREDIAEGISDTASLHRRYLAELARIVEEIGLEIAVAETGIERSRLEALPDRDEGLTVEEVTEILALQPEAAEASTIRRNVRDHLILEMSSAVVDVDALASGLDGDLGPRDYQQMIEGRMAMPLREYARIYRFVAENNPF